MSEIEHPIPHGTLATRDILDALPSGSIVCTYSGGWVKGDDDWWGDLLAPGGEDNLRTLYGDDDENNTSLHPKLRGRPAIGAKWRPIERFQDVAYIVLWDSTDAWKGRGLFKKELYKENMEAIKAFRE